MALCIMQTIKGPDDTPYTGGIYQIDITIPQEYPFSPPKMKFLTKRKQIPFSITLIKTH